MCHLNVTLTKNQLVANYGYRRSRWLIVLKTFVWVLFYFFGRKSYRLSRMYILLA